MRTDFDFEDLDSLKNYLTSIRRNHVPTMNHYASKDNKGFWHQPSKQDKSSLSSTATCVSSLVHAGAWNHKRKKWGNTEAIAERLLRKPWQSAGLKENNPFGLSFIAEGVLDLNETDPYEKHQEHLEIIKKHIIPELTGEVENSTAQFAVPGSISISPYPPSAYLTQLAFRVLKRCIGEQDSNYEELNRSLRTWARSEIHRQVALVSTSSRIADPLQLAYAIILAASASADEQTSPEEKALTREALKIFFGSQLSDGTWPPSQPLFHYPDVGNAQCFDYELLTQLLSCEQLQNELLQFLPQLKAAALQLRHTSFDLGASANGLAVGWASGHHPQIEGPESWSTACVYDFVHALDRLVAEAIRQSLFKEIPCIYTPPVHKARAAKKPEDFAPNFLDATINFNGKALSLKDTLRDTFVLPIDREKLKVANGGRLEPTTPMSAILYGPPGTSKTQLAEIISDFLGWPLLSVDPSYLVQDGMEHLYARANRLFSMLATAEQVVVLLDEFDEMGRDRAQSTEALSRFITTSMLPKLAAINKGRKIVFLLATNYVSQFDAAFSRGGRFDMILQVMPPTKEAKLGFSSWSSVLRDALDKIKGRTGAEGEAEGAAEGEAEGYLADLTYLETQQLVASLGPDMDAWGTFDEFKNAHDRGTLCRESGSDAKTWKTTCTEEEQHIRLPRVNRS